ncbi:MAG: hypothetical protein CFE21_14680 [Bacteroidetes bacterium B1(2017)]|nr:MAG: hypothetical protein CFE21_14680 [Bacteroidetes bacterium B1(2017)]
MKTTIWAKMPRLSYLFFVLFSGVIVSCSHYDQIQADLKESGSGEDESHNSGQNCASCHNVSGSEAAREGGWWTVAGTVYTNSGNLNKGVTVELWEKPGKQGKLIKRLTSDSKGNFYTNQILNFGNGVYPSISVGSNTKSMTQGFSGGSCNSCHGVTTNKLTIN